jgi:hypothetical protein
MRKLIKKNILLLCTLALLSVTAAYAQNSSWHTEGAHAPSPAVIKKPRLTEINNILDHHEDFVGKTVTVQGSFRGWKKKCLSSSMLKRSDWVLEDETGCIYVTGRIPASLSPFRPKGEKVLVRGRVLITKKGKPVIKAAKITLLQN